MPYVNGHNRRKKVRYLPEDRGYRSLCWIWQLGKTIWGYGTTSSRAAHRQVFLEEKGWLPDGPLDHLCRQRDCVNPDHLEPVTPAVNVQRGRLAKLDQYGAMTIHLLNETTSLTRVQIADVVGVSPATVFAVLRGQVWQNCHPTSLR